MSYSDRSLRAWILSFLPFFVVRSSMRFFIRIVMNFLARFISYLWLKVSSGCLGSGSSLSAL